jgi:hypothetical protein
MNDPRIQQPTLTADSYAVETVATGWPWRLLASSVIIFILAIFVYAGLRFGYGPYLDRQIVSLDTSLASLSQSVAAAEQERFVNFYSQIVNVKTVLGKHAFASNALTFLERATTGPVYYTSAELDTNATELKLRGVTTSFDALAGQIAVFEQTKGVARVTLTDVKFTSTGVTFTLSVIFTSDFFKEPTL